MVKEFDQELAENIIAEENKILDKLGYEGGGYYKDQPRNHIIYKAVKKKLTSMKIPKLSQEYYGYFENQNYHSLNSLLIDLGKL